MRPAAHLVLPLFLLCLVNAGRCEADFLPVEPSARSAGEWPRLDDPVGQVTVVRLLLDSIERSTPVIPWGGTIAGRDDPTHDHASAFATIDCGRVRPEGEVRKPVRPKATAGRAVSETGWLPIVLLGAMFGLGGLAAEIARPPRHGLVAYGRLAQTSSWISRPS